MITPGEICDFSSCGDLSQLDAPFPPCPTETMLTGFTHSNRKPKFPTH